MNFLICILLLLAADYATPLAVVEQLFDAAARKDVARAAALFTTDAMLYSAKTDYDFHLGGKFSHCGIDSFSLLKTGTGWKIASTLGYS